MFERVSGIARRLFRRCLDTRYYILNTLLLLLSPLAANALVPISNPLSGTRQAFITPGPLYARLIALFTTFAGVLFLIGVIYGGFLMMTSAGNEEKADQGKRLIVWSSIGMAVILGAYVIASFVISTLNKNALLITP